MIIVLFATVVFATEKKLEIGAGVLSLTYPNYIGSKESSILITPFPHIRYKNKYIKIDEDGINGKLFGINGLSVDLSLSGSLPSNNESNGVREGMSDLDMTFEVGPKLVYKIYKNKFGNLKFEFPVRIILSTDLTNLHYQGVNLSPEFQYTYTNGKFKLYLRSSALFADTDYHNYFYQVKPEYETALRENYNSEAGFSGFRNSIGFNYKKDKWWFGGFVANFNIADAVFKDSPLVETSEAYYAGISVAYIFHTSK